MPSLMIRRVLVLVCCLGASPAFAQPPVAVETDLTFYGDNTEFHNPFRKGETLLGVHGRLFVEADLSDRTALRLGVFGNQRFGAEHGFHNVRPVVALVIRGREHELVFGALDPGAPVARGGPDRDGPHGLLAPLQRETLAFTRGYEAGLQWIRRTGRERHEAWINWQQLNTPGQREIFDAGLNGRLSLAPAFALALQTHVVHHGGQLFQDGPVSDSVVVGPGAVVTRPLGRLERVTAEFYLMGSFYRPDREQRSRDRWGVGGLARVSGERAGWRGHLLAWRGCDFIKEEGDENYLSLRRDGRRYRGIRDYSEVGVTRIVRLAPDGEFQASARLHRVEGHYEYSYRLVARVKARWKLW